MAVWNYNPKTTKVQRAQAVSEFIRIFNTSPEEAAGIVDLGFVKCPCCKTVQVCDGLHTYAVSSDIIECPYCDEWPGVD